MNCLKAFVFFACAMTAVLGAGYLLGGGESRRFEDTVLAAGLPIAVPKLYELEERIRQLNPKE
jgi:hypothetical protein